MFARHLATAGCLPFLPGSCCPHYDGEEQRRPVFQRFFASGELADGWAADDGAALVFQGESLSEIVSSRSGGAAYRVERSGESGVIERRIEARFLGKA